MLFPALVLAGFGLDQFQTILYNMIPGAIGIVANIIAAYIATKTARKMPVLLGIAIFPVAAAGALYALPRGDQYRQQLLAVYFLLQIFQPLTPIMFSWAFSNTAGHTKKTTTTGMLLIGLTTGNIVGPQLYLSNEAPYYKTGLTGNLVVLCIMFGLIILQAMYLKYLNKRNEKRRLASGKVGRNVDYSMVNSSQWAKMKAEEKVAAGGKVIGEDAQIEGEAVINNKAFDDLTDLQNEDFIYTL